MTEKDVFKLRKQYFNLYNNLARAMRKSFLLDNERKVMQTEVDQAKKAWDEAEEQYQSRKK